MQFSNTTLKNGVIQRIEDHTQLGDGVITGDDTLLKKMTANVNESLYDLTTEIMILNDSFEWDDPYKTDYPIATTPLVAGQRDYQFDNISFLKLKRVDVSYDGVNYYRATPFDSAAYFGERGLGNDTVTDEDFEKTQPMYDPKAFGFWLYPRADAGDVTSNGKIRIEYYRTFDEFGYDDTTKEVPIDRNFHDLVAIGASLKWPQLDAENYNKLTLAYTQGLERFRKHYSKRNEDRFLTFATNLNSNYK
jgi:hypothetical protein